MKKIIATTLCLGLVGTAAFGQGTIGSGGANASTTDFYTYNPFSGSNAPTLTASSSVALYDYEVLTASSTLPLGPLGYVMPNGTLASLLNSNVWTDTGVMYHNTALAGRVADGGAVANGWPVGAAQDFVIVGWSANLGTWANVEDDIAGLSLQTVGTGYEWVGNADLGQGVGYLGATIVGQVVAGPAGAGPSLFGLQATGASPINTTTALYLVNTATPEPTMFAMTGLGAACLLMFRRRR